MYCVGRLCLLFQLLDIYAIRVRRMAVSVLAPAAFQSAGCLLDAIGLYSHLTFAVLELSPARPRGASRKDVRCAVVLSLIL